MKKLAMALALAGFVLGGSVAAATGKRITVTGEVIDSWCYISQIMYAQGTAHHQCALWCAAGGIPVGVLGDDGRVYVVLMLEGDATSVANPAVLRIQTHRVTVDGDFYERDGMHYLVVNRVEDDQGIVNVTHDEYDIQPFGK